MFRLFARSMAVLIGAALIAANAAADTYPSRTIRILTGFAAGGPGDGVARIYAQKLQELLGAPVIVDNRPGAYQLQAIKPLMTSAPDGYTVFLATASSLVQGPGVLNDLPYDPLKNFTLISMMAKAPGVFFVHSGMPTRTMGDLIGYARANPGKVTFGSAGTGSADHLQFEYLMNVTGAQMTHIPYRSGAAMAMDVGAGNVQIGLATPTFVMPLIPQGRVVALAVTGSDRIGALPNVPSLAEAQVQVVKGIDYFSFYGLVGPAGLPREVVDKLNEAIGKIAAMPDVAAKLRETLQMEPASGSAASFRQYVDTELVKWREVGKKVKLSMSGG